MWSGRPPFGALAAADVRMSPRPATAIADRGLRGPWTPHGYGEPAPTVVSVAHNDPLASRRIDDFKRAIPHSGVGVNRARTVECANADTNGE
jgi:hypothetical protein